MPFMPAPLTKGGLTTLAVQAGTCSLVMYMVTVLTVRLSRPDKQHM